MVFIMNLGLWAKMVLVWVNPRLSNTQDTLRLDESESDEAPDDESDESNDDLSEESNDDDLNSLFFQMILEIKLNGVNIT